MKEQAQAVAAEPVTLPAKSPPSLIAKFAGRFGVEPGKLLTTLKQTAFKQPADKQTGQIVEVSNEEMMSLLIVADQYGLNPFTKEIYAFRDRKRGGIVPIVGIDGWSRIVNEHPQFNGVTFAFGDKDGKPIYVECTMARKDREQSTTVREYLNENKRDTDAWAGMPSRMLRHRAFIQCARLTFGFVGIHDEDEARGIIEGTIIPENSAVDDLNSEITGTATRVEEGAQGKEAASKKVADQTPPAVTFAEVAHKLGLAEGKKDADMLNEARDLIRSVPDERQRAELDVEAKRIAKVIEGKDALEKR